MNKEEAVKAAIETITQRADDLNFIYGKNAIASIEDCGFTFVLLRHYFDPSDTLSPSSAYFSKSALEVHYVSPEAFNNVKHCGDPLLREMLERGYTVDEVIPFLGVVVRVIVRCAALFAIISPDGEIMFGDDEDTSTHQQYRQARLAGEERDSFESYTEIAQQSSMHVHGGSS